MFKSQITSTTYFSIIFYIVDLTSTGKRCQLKAPAQMK